MTLRIGRLFRALGICAVVNLLYAADLAWGAEPPSPPMAELVRSEFAELAKAWALDVRLEISEDPELFSMPGGVVSIGLRRLRRDLDELPAQRRRQIVRFYVAHELWHQWQYANGAGVLTQEGERWRAAECQADVMAATTIGSEQALDGANMYPALVQLVGSLGSTAHIDGSHPSQSQRTAAIRVGLLRRAYEQAASAAGVADRAGMQRIADVRAGERMSEWSARACRKILKLDPTALAHVEFEDESVKWNTDGAEPYVDFSGKYRNVSDREILLEGALYVITRSRTDRDEQLSQQMVDAYHFELRLPGNKEATVRKRLEWYGDKQMMPVLVYSPRGERALYSAKFVGESPTSCSGKAAALGAAGLNRLTGVLQAFADDSANGYSSFRGQLESIDSTKSVYLSKLEIPQSEETRIEVESEDSFVSGGIYTGASETLAKEAFNAYSGMLAKWCQAPSVQPRVRTSSTGTRAEAVRFSSNMSVGVSMTNWRDKRFRVRVQLRARPRQEGPTCLGGGLPSANKRETDFANTLFLMARDVNHNFANLRTGLAYVMEGGDFVYALSAKAPDGEAMDFFESPEAPSAVVASILAPQGKGVEIYRELKSAIEQACPSHPGEVRESLTRDLRTYTIPKFTQTSSLELHVLGDRGFSPVLKLKSLRKQ